MSGDERPVSLHGVFWETPDEQLPPGTPDLLTAIRENWYAAMSANPGFLGGAVLAPTGSDDGHEGITTGYDFTHSFETISFWRTEGDRMAWAATEPHDTEFPKVIDRVYRRISNRQE